ncbi:MAG: hypothetical protein RLZZ01_171, partial [Actinomycetota bacterium]
MGSVDRTRHEASNDVVVRRTQRRTTAQRAAVVALVLAACCSFAAAGGLAFGYWVLSDRQLVTLAEPSVEIATDDREPVVVVPGLATSTTSAIDSDTSDDVVLAEPGAANFMIVGADNNDCTVDGA